VVVAASIVSVAELAVFVFATLDRALTAGLQACTTLPMTNTDLFEEALAKVESKSIRAWAKSDHNQPLWLEICENAIKNGRKDADAMAAYIVIVAMGM
jgi:hypothetical protein